MDNKTAEMIARKAKALKHCDKVLTSIDRYGSTRLRLNCTGVEFEVKKGDAIYLTIQATKYNLLREIGSYNIVKSKSAGNSRQALGDEIHQESIRELDKEAKKKSKPIKEEKTQKRTRKAYEGETPEERQERKREEHREYMRQRYNRLKAQKNEKK